MRVQKGSVAPVVLLAMLSVVVFAYYSYDMSRSYLAAKVQINTTSELNDLAAISGNTTWNVEQQIAKANGLDVDDFNDDWTFGEYNDDEVIYMTESLQMQQHRKLTASLNGVNNDSFSVSSKTIRTKHYEDLDVIIAISNDPQTRSLVNGVKYDLNDALKLLFDKTNSTITVIPYGYRINFGSNKCGTTFPRNDGFSFKWWENYFAQLDILKILNQEKDEIERNLSSAKSQVLSNQQRINEINSELADADVDPEVKDQLEAEKEDLQRNNEILNSNIDDYQSDLEDKEKLIEEQEKAIANLEATDTYIDYKVLAYHYAKVNYDGANYLYLDNYFDGFLESNNYSYTENDAISDSSKTNMSNVDDLSIAKNKYFGDVTTCPTQQVVSNSTNYGSFLSVVNNMNFSDSFVSPIQGFNSSLKKAFNLSNKRTVVINITALIDSYLSEQDQKNEDKEILSSFCQTIQQKYVNDVAAKSIFLVDSMSNIDDIEALDCANAWNKSTGIINIDEVQNLTDRISYELMQESSSTYIGNKDEEE